VWVGAEAIRWWRWGWAVHTCVEATRRRILLPQTKIDAGDGWTQELATAGRGSRRWLDAGGDEAAGPPPPNQDQKAGGGWAWELATAGRESQWWLDAGATTEDA
jgi:hypothetical protein